MDAASAMKGGPLDPTVPGSNLNKFQDRRVQQSLQEPDTGGNGDRDPITHPTTSAHSPVHVASKVGGSAIIARSPITESRAVGYSGVRPVGSLRGALAAKEARDIRVSSEGNRPHIRATAGISGIGMTKRLESSSQAVSSSTYGTGAISSTGNVGKTPSQHKGAIPQQTVLAGTEHRPHAEKEPQILRHGPGANNHETSDGLSGVLPDARQPSVGLLAVMQPEGAKSLHHASSLEPTVSAHRKQSSPGSGKAATGALYLSNDSVLPTTDHQTSNIQPQTHTMAPMSLSPTVSRADRAAMTRSSNGSRGEQSVSGPADREGTPQSNASREFYQKNPASILSGLPAKDANIGSVKSRDTGSASGRPPLGPSPRGSSSKRLYDSGASGMRAGVAEKSRLPAVGNRDNSDVDVEIDTLLSKTSKRLREIQQDRGGGMSIGVTSGDADGHIVNTREVYESMEKVRRSTDNDINIPIFVAALERDSYSLADALCR